MSVVINVLMMEVCVCVCVCVHMLSRWHGLGNRKGLAPQPGEYPHSQGPALAPGLSRQLRWTRRPDGGVSGGRRCPWAELAGGGSDLGRERDATGPWQTTAASSC